METEKMEKETENRKIKWSDYLNLFKEKLDIVDDNRRCQQVISLMDNLDINQVKKICQELLNDDSYKTILEDTLKSIRKFDPYTEFHESIDIGELIDNFLVFDLYVKMPVDHLLSCIYLGLPKEKWVELIENISDIKWKDKSEIFNKFKIDYIESCEPLRQHNGVTVEDTYRLNSNFKLSRKDFWEKYIKN